MATKKISFTVKFSMVTVANITAVVIILSFIFFYNLRVISERDAEVDIDATMLLLQEEVTANFDHYATLLKEIASAVSTFAAINQPLPREYLVALFEDSMKTIPDTAYLYYSNNTKWNEPGGMLVLIDQKKEDWIPSAEYDQTKRGWFSDAKKAGGKIAYSVPYVEATNGYLVITLSMTVFDRKGVDLGVAAIDLTVNKLIAFVNTIGIDSSHKIFLLDRGGLFISHPDESAVLKKDFFTEFGLERYRQKILTQAKFFSRDKEIFLHSVAIPDTDWLIASIIPTATIFAESNKLFAMLIGITIGLLTAALIVSVLLTAAMLTTPIRHIEEVAKSLADMNFAVEFDTFRNDELGDMQHALIKIRDKLRVSIDELNANLAAGTAHRDKLKAIIKESADSLKVIGKGTEVMKEKSDSQGGSVSHTSVSIQDILQQIELLDHAVQAQAAHITESSAAIEQMVANVDSIRAIVGNTGNTTATLCKSSQKGRKMLSQLKEELSRIAEQSKTLQTANKTISDIAGQTNILAMNAAIEAAHAGESGKGFAVVAGEIRKLAELSSKESESISTEIKKMETVIGSIAKVSSETVGSMDTIFQEITAMDASFSQIKNAVDEQSAGGSQILIALKGIQDITGQVKDGSSVIYQKSETIAKEMGVLTRASQEVTESVHEVRAASTSIASFLENAKIMANEFS